jgi:hypothetical protein
MRNSSWGSVLASALALFVARSNAQTLDSVLSGESTLSTYYSLIQVRASCSELGTTPNRAATEISRYLSIAALERRNCKSLP